MLLRETPIVVDVLGVVRVGDFDGVGRSVVIYEQISDEIHVDENHRNTSEDIDKDFILGLHFVIP